LDLLRRPALLLVCLASLAARPSAAWGPDGHRIVGEIAWHELTPATRRALRDLLPTGRYGTLAEASVWADTEARRIASDRWLEPYHFVDADLSSRHVDAPDDCTCVLGGIARFRGELRDPEESYRERVVALRLVAHFVGDVHQPLHVAAADGRGGTRTMVIFLGRRQTLHQVWDSGLIEHQLGRRRARTWARELIASIGDAQRARWTADMSPRAWADESLALARRESAIRAGTRLGDDYFAREIPVVAERLEQAGVRLGALLNGIFDPAHSMH